MPYRYNGVDGNSIQMYRCEMTPADIISLWPSAERFADDIGLKHRSHGRVMRLRNSIPARYWDGVLKAAATRGFQLSREMLERAHSKSVRAAAAS